MKTKTQKKLKLRNWLAVHVHFRSGAGPAKNTKKYSRKVKHRARDE